jgi:hypothetical protein
MPTEFPDLDLPYIGKSWESYQLFLQEIGDTMTPEIIIPPELLIPWVEDPPMAIEILEEQEFPENKLDMKVFNKILDELIESPTMVPTMVDFAISQTNVKASVRFNTLEQAIKANSEKKKLTDYKYVTIPNWIDRGCPTYPDFSIRTPVWKRPSEYRDAVCTPPSTLFKVWKLNTYLKQMMRHLPEVGDHMDSAKFKNFVKNSPILIMTDWKKSGLTIPHWYVNLVVEKVNKFLPDKEKIDWPKNGWPILDPKTGKVFYPNGYGYGLGMVNNAYTLFNIALFRYAQSKGIFSEEDKMLSFNDDSIISTGKSHPYYSWLRVCTQSGAYLDSHKTFSSKNGIFCELYQMKTQAKCSFKWVSMFHTAVWSLLKCVNHHQWRFRISEIWEATTLYSSDICPGGVKWSDRIGTIACTLMSGYAAVYWGKEFNYDLPPELGGVALGQYFRTELSLKTGLTILEEMNVVDFVNRSRYMYHYKQSLHEYPTFSPWKKFPEGETKKTFKRLGSLKGLNFELSPLLEKAENKFLLDRTWFEEEYWNNFWVSLELILKNQEFIPNFWDWAKEQSWSSYSVPRKFVSSSLELGANENLIFASVVNNKPEYSLATIAEAYYDIGQETLPSIPKDKIDFSSYLSFETVVTYRDRHYYCTPDMENISRMMEFSNPKRVWLDYAIRNSEIITGLDIKDNKGEAALSFMEKVWNVKFSRDTFIGASWWTIHPLPFKKEWLPYLSTTPISSHFDLLLALNAGKQVLDGMIFNPVSEDELAEIIKANKHYWDQVHIPGSKDEEVQRQVDVMDLYFGEGDVDETSPFHEFLKQTKPSDLGNFIDSWFQTRNLKEEPPDQERASWWEDTLKNDGQFDNSFLETDQRQEEIPDDDYLSEEGDYESDLLASMLESQEFWDADVDNPD